MRNSGSSRFGKSIIAKIPRATAPFDAKHSQDGRPKKRGCVGGEGGAVAEKSERSHDAHDCANLRVARCALVQLSVGVVRDSTVEQAFFEWPGGLGDCLLTGRQKK